MHTPYSWPCGDWYHMHVPGGTYMLLLLFLTTPEREDIIEPKHLGEHSPFSTLVNGSSLLTGLSLTTVGSQAFSSDPNMPI